MGKIKTFLFLLKEKPEQISVALFPYIYKTGLYRFFTDKAYIKAAYRAYLKKKINLKNPQTFNEKLNWLKLYNRNPQYTQLVDKYNVKAYITEKIGKDYIIPTIDVWDSVEDIEFDELPNKFVLKCTHDSGSTIVCKNKENFDIETAKKKLEKKLKRNMFYWGREWPYKNVKPQVIAEEYMQDNETPNLPVYKFMCFNGVPKIIQTIQNDKQPNESIDYFDTEWNLLDIKQNYPNSKNPFEKPAQLKEMLEIATKLSQGHSFIRVDLYIINEEIKFSEFTFYSDCGFTTFVPEKWDEVLGSWIELPKQ